MSIVSSDVTIPVRRSDISATWKFVITCFVDPEGKPARYAKADEVEVAIQYEWGWSQWTTEPKWVRRVSGSVGQAVIPMDAADMRFGEDGKYRAWCVHLVSGAVVSREIHLDADGNPTFFTPVLEDAGNEMPQDFAVHVGDDVDVVANLW